MTIALSEPTVVVTAVVRPDGGVPALRQWRYHTLPVWRNEGVDWIRGEYTEDSPEGKALLAAWMLAHDEHSPFQAQTFAMSIEVSAEAAAVIRPGALLARRPNGTVGAVRG